MNFSDNFRHLTGLFFEAILDVAMTTVQPVTFEQAAKLAIFEYNYGSEIIEQQQAFVTAAYMVNNNVPRSKHASIELPPLYVEAFEGIKTHMSATGPCTRQEMADYVHEQFADEWATFAADQVIKRVAMVERYSKADGDFIYRFER